MYSNFIHKFFYGQRERERDCKNITYLNHGKRKWNHKGQHKACKNKIVMFESILILVVGLLHYFMVPHVPDNGN